jgi:ribosomal protein S18 acetylase RimI-like enzyme
MVNWLLHPATDEDAATLLAVIHAAFEEFRGRLDPPSGAHRETLESIRQKMASAQAVLAFVNEVAAGCVFYEVGPDHLYFFRLAVLPAYRRGGLERALIDFVETRARALGLARVRLGVRLALAWQRDSYERLGYRHVEWGYHDGYPEPTHVYLEKEVGPAR